MKIKKLQIEGFRSLKNVLWEPGDLNIIIGPNGAGKSNLLRFAEFIAACARGELGTYIQTSGGMLPLLWDEQAREIAFALWTDPVQSEAGPEHYELHIVPQGGSSYMIQKELLRNYLRVKKKEKEEPFKFIERTAHSTYIFAEDERKLAPVSDYSTEGETVLFWAASPFAPNRYILAYKEDLASIAVYQDLHMGKNSAMRQPAVAKWESQLKPDGQNLITVLHTLYTSNRNFEQEIDAAMKGAFGDDYEKLVFPPAADQRIQLRIRWTCLKQEQSSADLSDGTLRFLSLLTILANPSPPSVVAIDEPETGLHPAMQHIIAEYAMQAARKSQVILTTHSPEFLDIFKGDTTPAPVVAIAKWKKGETNLETPDKEKLQYWLNRYTLGELFRSGEAQTMK